ncbi:MAG: orotate phosphoribosyltransferase [Thaumarchaeota archaeon]|nr:orotate phosphoribosyltransferase [Nitrososphaerota archaeon]
MTKSKGIEKDLAAILVESGALTFGKFKLSSGKLSTYYLDLRVLPSRPQAFNRVIEAYSVAIKGVNGAVDMIGGVPTSGLTFATALAYSLAKPMIYVRDKKKSYGKSKKIEGVLTPGSNVILIDDLVTSGASIISAAEAIRDEGGLVKECIVLIDREEGAQKNLLRSSIRLHSISTISTIATQLHESGHIDRNKMSAILRETQGSN